MAHTLQISAKPFGFNYKPVLLIIAIVGLAFILTNYLTARVASEPITAFATDDALELAEEIYNKGEVGDLLNSLPLEAAAIKKLTDEIARQLAKTVDYPGCEVYFLVAQVNNPYPVLGYGDEIIGFEELLKEEVWKVGMTKNGEEGRYSNKIYFNSKKNNLLLSGDLLRYTTVSNNLTYKQAIILEKILIYTYPFWSGHDLPKPPGCKIYR